MGNEGQQAPLPEREASEKQEYYGWQYDQDDATELFQRRASTPARAPMPPQSPPHPPLPNPTTRAPQMPANYHEPIQDMGTSLGYGQGMEYQYFDTPQPSQPIPQLRQERLQQLREARMRNQQRRMKPDSSGFMVRGVPNPPYPPVRPPQSPTLQGPPGASGPLAPDIGVQPIRQSTSRPLPAASLPYQEPRRLSGRLPASAPAEDTGMIQRVRIGRATLILTGAFIASRVLGLLRNSLFLFILGAHGPSDAYYQAFLVPDLIFNMVAGGALSSAFIPVFTKYMVAEKNEKTAWYITSAALNLAVGLMAILALIVIIFADKLVPLYNSHVKDPAEMALIISLTRIMLLQSIVMGAGVIVTAVLQASQDFRRPAIGTVLYNIGLILGLMPGLYFVFVTGHGNDTVAVYAATWGVVLGAIMQVGFQVPGLFKVGMHYKLTFDWRHAAVIQIARQMVPRVINAAMLSFSTFVDRILINLLAVVVVAGTIDGQVTLYLQAFSLMLLPLGIFGQSVATAAFPTMTENVAKGRMDRVRNTILETLRSILFMSIPSSIGLIVLGLPIIQVLFQHRAFDLTAAQGTAVPLAFFAVGLAGHASVEILTRSFYAMRDSTTPVIISVGQFIFKIALSLVLINVAIYGVQWGLAALAFATSIAALLEAVVMFWVLHQRIGELIQRAFLVFIGRVLLASLAMAAGLLVTRFGLDFVLSTTNEPALGVVGTAYAIIKLLIELFVGIFIYIRVARYLGIEELGPVKRMLDRFKLSWI